MITTVSFLSSQTPPDKKLQYNKQFGLFTQTTKIVYPDANIIRLFGDGAGSGRIDWIRGFIEVRKAIAGPMLMIDSDCVFVKPIDDLFEKDFDVGILYRYNWTVGKHRQDYNTGVVYFSGRRHDKEIEFLNQWLDECRKYEKDEPWYYDQIALYKIVGDPPETRTKDGYHFIEPYTAAQRDGFLFLDVFEWGCPIIWKIADRARIIHYNHFIRLKEGENDTLQESPA